MASILIVDDDIQIVQVLEKILSQQGYKTLTCNSGELALSMATARQPNLIILDAMMPKLDGYQVLWHLRDRAETREIPTIMLSARSSLQDTQQGLKLGAKAYLFKPFNAETVLTCVDDVLRGRSEETMPQRVAN